MDNTMDDREITELLYSEDPQGPVQLDKKYRGLCESIALHILGNREDAEECASDALMKVYGSIPPEKPAFLKAFTLKAASVPPLTVFGKGTPADAQILI